MERVGLERRDLCGVDFLEPVFARECLRLLDEHGVLVFRNANIDDATLAALSRSLGEVVIPPAGGEIDHPEVAAISLDPRKDAHAAFRKGTFYWHIDGATDAVPQKATLLSALEVAEEGGDTEFASTYLAYDALPEERKAALSAVRVVHSFAAAQSLVTPNPRPEMRAAWDRVPTRTHPLVWTRPNGRRSLLVGATAGEVVGMDAAAGRGLLDELLAWCTQGAFVFRHRWQRGDLVIWDNTGMLHRALPYAADSRRLLHRTTLAGDVAVQ